MPKLQSGTKLEFVLNWLLQIFLFVFPWQTVFIIREEYLGGVKLEYSAILMYATEGLLWLTVFVFLWWYWQQASERVKTERWHMTRDRWFVLGVLVFVLYTYGSIAWAGNTAVALQQALHLLEAILVWFVLLLGPLSFRGALQAIMLGSILPSVLGIYQFLHQEVVGSTLLGVSSQVVSDAGTSVVVGETLGRWLRAYGPFSHPNVFGGYLLLSIVSVMVYVRRHVANEILTGRHLRTDHVLPVVVLVLNIFALVFSFSRSAWLGALMLGVIVVSESVRQRQWLYRRVAVYGLLTTVVAIALVFPLLQNRVVGTSVAETRAVIERVELIGQAMKLHQQHRLLGVGVGNYTIEARSVYPDVLPWAYQPVHNIPLLLLVELGLVGIGLICLVCWLGIRAFLSWSYLKCSAWFAVLLPALFLDHYLYTSWVGLSIAAIFCYILAKSSVSPSHEQSLHTLSPPSG